MYVELEMATGKIPHDLRKFDFTVTTNGNGISVTALQEYAFPQMVDLSTNSYFATMRKLHGGAWYLILEHYDGTRVPNQEVSGTIWYKIRNS